MGNTTRRYKIRLLAMAAMTAVGSVTAGAAQYIDTATPEATQESSGGVWGTLRPDQSSTRSTQVEGDVYVLPSSGAEVVVADGITVSAAEAQVEDQIIFESEFGLGAIAVLRVPRVDPGTVRDNYVDGFGESMDSIDEVESNASRKEASGIYKFVSSGLPMYMFISVDGATIPGYMIIEVFVGEPDKMADGISLARENISVEGVEMFKDIDEQEIEDVVVREDG